MRLFHAVAVAALVWLCGIASAPAQAPGTPGTYDYYILSLSWSPAFCASRGHEADPRQCATEKQMGFVVHGLWPQYDRGGWPERCSTMRTVPPRVLEAMLEIMPSGSLVEHEWAKHGSCTGLSPDDYFAETRATWERVYMPDELRNPPPGFSMSIAELRKELVERNSTFGLGPKGIAIECEGNQVTELRLCVDKDLFFRDCGAKVQDQCRANARLTAR